MPMLHSISSRVTSRLLSLMVLVVATAACGAQVDVMLSNGMRVLARERADDAIVSLRLSFPAGAAAEPESLAGIAHLAEHMLCDGEGWRQLALYAIGPNAQTTASAMEFTCKCLPSLLPRVLEAEAARMREAHLDSASFARERSVVLEELAYRGYRQSLVPAAVAFRLAFPGHPYGRVVGGSPRTVERISLEDLGDFVRRNIGPGGAVLHIEGPVDPEAAIDLVRARFGAIPGGSEPPLLPPYPAVAAGQSILDDPDHDGFRMALAIRAPVRDLRDVALLDLGLKWLEHEQIPCSWTHIPQEVVLTFAWLGPYVQRAATWEYLEKTFDPEMDAQRSLEWRWDRLNKAVAQITSSRRHDEVAAWLEEVLAGSRDLNVLDWLPDVNRVPGTPAQSLDEYETVLRSVTVPELQDFLGRVLDPGRACVAVSHGGDSGRIAYRPLAARVERGGDVSAVGALERLTAADCGPALQAYADSGALRLSRRVLGNGVPAYFLRTSDHASLRIAGWRRFAPPAECRADRLPGLSRLYNRIVDVDPEPAAEGEPARHWACEGAFLLDPGGLYTFSAKGRAGQAADISAALVRRLDDPTFNIGAWSSALEWGREDFGLRNHEPQARAAAWRLAQILGEDHAAVSAWRPDARALEHIRYKDLQKLHRSATEGAGRTALLASGGEPPAELAAALESTFGVRGREKDWSPGLPPAGPDRPVGLIVPALGAQDIMLTVTFPAVQPPSTWPHPGLAMLWSETAVRKALDARLRQQGGWTYMTTCDLQVMGGWVVPEIRVTCQPGQAPAVLAILRGELSRLAAEGVSIDLAARSRLALVQGLVSSGTDPAGLQTWLSFATAFEPVGRDPVGDVLGLKADMLSVSLAALFPEGRFAWTAVGAILEDDLPLFGE